MASCYNCGQTGSDYRRTIQTGYSKGTYYGKRTSYSIRTNYGMRTLCEHCAFSLDKGRIVIGIVLRWIIAAVLIYFLIK